MSIDLLTLLFVRFALVPVCFTKFLNNLINADYESAIAYVNQNKTEEVM